MKEIKEKSIIERVKEKTEVKDYIIEGYKVAVLSDIHFPFVDFKMLDKIKVFIKKQKVDAIVILGDLVDFYQLSTFSKEMKIDDTITAIKFAKEYLKELNIIIPKVYYRLGNHEERLEKYIYNKSKEIAEILEIFLDFESYFGAVIVKKNDILRYGNFFLYHGHEFNIRSINPARRILERFGINMILGHYHKLDKAIEKRMIINENEEIKNQIMRVYTLPPLCNPPLYNKNIVDYIRGFCIMEKNNNIDVNIYLYNSGEIIRY